MENFEIIEIEIEKIDELKIKQLNNEISNIKQSLLNIKKLCKNQQQAYLYKDVIINLTENILFLFFNC